MRVTSLSLSALGRVGAVNPEGSSAAISCRYMNLSKSKDLTFVSESNWERLESTIHCEYCSHTVIFSRLFITRTRRVSQSTPHIFLLLRLLVANQSQKRLRAACNPHYCSNRGTQVCIDLSMTMGLQSTIRPRTQVSWRYHNVQKDYISPVSACSEDTREDLPRYFPLITRIIFPKRLQQHLLFFSNSRDKNDRGECCRTYSI